MDALPLTPFEELMLWEDRPAYPFSVFLRVHFEGRLERADWQLALHSALRVHPLLRCRVEQRGRRPHWILTEDVPELDWIETDDPLPDEIPRGPHLDLFSGIGLRVTVVVAREETDAIFQFHHACCDGAGFQSFVHDVCVAYAIQRGAADPAVQLPPYDLGRLRERNRFGLTWWKFLKMLPGQLHGLQGARQFLSRQPVQVVSHPVRPDESPPPAVYPASVRHVFAPEATLQLRQNAQRQKATVNELLTRDLFLTLARFRHENGYGHGQEWLRMMVPVNLRAPEDRLLPAANVVSSIFLDRRGDDCADPEQLLVSIHDELELIRRNQLGLTFHFSLALCRLLPGGIRKSARAQQCPVSCVFTNVGKAMMRSPLPKSAGRLIVGDTILESFQGLIPIRPHSCLTFGTHQYARSLVMDVHYDADALSSTQAQRLLELFLECTGVSLAAAC